MRYTPVMAGSAILHRPPSVREYLEMEESSTARHEYVAGVIHARARATRRQNLIAGNVFARLWIAARRSSCRIFQNDMKLRVADDVLYYPDIIVAYGPEGDDPLIEDAPCLVVEVASPSTEQIDRREKMIAYRQIPTMRAYLIVAQDSRRVEHHWRTDSGEWFAGEATDDNVIPIPCPETKLSLDDIYEGL